MNWSGHWHGYGPWIGSRSEYGQEHLRRPGTSPGDEQTRMFMASTIPPIQTGHVLLRRHQAARDRTWTTVQEAVDWLTKNFNDRPPFERADGLGAYLSLASRIEGAEEYLPLGADTIWAYYTRSGAFMTFEVICCPSRLHPDILCPLPPG